MARTWLDTTKFPYGVLISLENTEDFKEYMKNDHSYSWLCHETKTDILTAKTLFMFKDEKWAIDAERAFNGMRTVAITDEPSHKVNVHMKDISAMQDWLLSKYWRSMYDVRYDMDRPAHWAIWLYFHDTDLAVEFKLVWGDRLLGIDNGVPINE